MRKLSGSQAASLIAVSSAAFVAVLFEPLPPLLEFINSEMWTRLIEWFGVSVAGLALLSWTGVTDMEFEVSSTGVKARRVQANEEMVEQLRSELQEMEQDNLRLRGLTRDLRKELLLLAPTAREDDQRALGVDDDAS